MRNDLTFKRVALGCVALMLLLAGCAKTAAPPKSGEYSITPGNVPTRARIAYEDRYLFFEDNSLLVDGSLYCPARELPRSAELTQTVTYEGAEYAPVRAYYEALGLNVSWDGDLGLVRVYENAPVYGEKASRKKVNVLLYHHILSDSENVKFRDNGSVISEAAFEAQMKYLSENGYTTITLLQLYDFLYNNAEVPDKSVLITFDDGYYSNFTRAYPILKKYGQTAALFSITGHLGESEAAEFDPDALQYFSISDMKAYSDVFEYASHTHVLHGYDKTGATPLSRADAYTIICDLGYSFEIVNNNMALAYPRGSYDRDIIEALMLTPIKLAFTTKSGSVKSGSDPYKLNRHIVWPDTSLKEFADMLD